MNLAIIGGKYFHDYCFLRKAVLSNFDTAFLDSVVSGGAEGADTLAEQFADEFKIPKIIFPAEWTKYGNDAGFIRNPYIIDAADMVIAFWDYQSNGTRDSIRLAKAAKKVCIVIDIREPEYIESPLSEYL
jgi:hypothetical protein